jgi:hypothetical protein
MASASLRISTFYLGIVILGLFSARALLADEVPESAETHEIEAIAYDLETVRPSRSGRVYLFQMGAENADEQLPAEGKLFLLRQGDTPVMAFRVLKIYPDRKRIAAKKLLPYEGFPSLDRGSKYRAYEKIGEKVVPVPPTPEDLDDLKDLESDSPEEIPAPPEDEALAASPPAEAPPSDVPPPPPPEGEDLSAGEVSQGEESTEAPAEAPAEEANSSEESSAEEMPAEEPALPGDQTFELQDTEDEEEADEIGGYFPNFFTMGVGLLAKTKVPGPGMKFGGGMIYSRNLSANYAAEFGFFYYKSSGDETGTTITTTIIPLLGNIRYQKRFGELITGYVYGGLMYPIVAENVGATKKQVGQIMTVYPAFGVGAFLQTGPNWYIRTNFGIDAIYLGVALRF